MSASCYFYLIAQLLHHICDLLSLLALDFDHAVFNSPTSATFLFKSLRHCFQVVGGEYQIFNKGHSFASASTGFAVQINGLLLRRKRLRLNRPRFLLAHITLTRRPDCFVVRHVYGFGMGVSTRIHPIPSYWKSFTTAPSKLTATCAGKVITVGRVQVNREVLTGLTSQVVSCSAI